VRIRDQRNRRARTCESPAEFRRHRGRAGVGGVHVKPQVMALADIGDGRHGVDAGGEVVPTVAPRSRGADRRRDRARSSRATRPATCEIRRRRAQRTLSWPMRRRWRLWRWKSAACSERRLPSRGPRPWNATPGRRLPRRGRWRACCWWKRCRRSGRNQSSGNPVQFRSQRSVHLLEFDYAGEVFHNMPLPLRAR